MKTFETILTETHGRVGIVRLNRPRAFNALNTQLINELAEALLTFDADPEVRAILLRGSDRAFSAGADIKALAPATAVDILNQGFMETWERATALRKPLIAAVSGHVLGGGFELTLMCDMVIASSTAEFGMPEISLGAMPGAGGTQRLTHAVGKALAMEIILNGRRLNAQEALHFGLVNSVHPVSSYFEAAFSMATSIASKAPIAIRLAKEAINKSFEMSLADGVAFERQAFRLLFSTEDQKEGMNAFLSKRPPDWKGK